jgi:hypothetical protein
MVRDFEAVCRSVSVKLIQGGVSTRCSVSEAAFPASCDAVLNFRTYLVSRVRTGESVPISGAPIVASFPISRLRKHSR